MLILLPLSWLVYYSLHDRAGAFTLANFAQLVTDPSFLDPLLTTVILATSSAVICCLVAAPMGWLVARTDMPLRRTVRALVTASFVTPPFLGAVAWELLAAPNSGLLNKAFRAATGAEPDDYVVPQFVIGRQVLDDLDTGLHLHADNRVDRDAWHVMLERLRRRERAHAAQDSNHCQPHHCNPAARIMRVR